MIPVTSLAGKTVAVFGLGGSGLASCHALKAGGAEVVAGDDNADNVAKAAQAGFITADLRTVSWANFAALILTPGAPLTHPAPHWSVVMARQAGVEVIGDVELFCRERRRHAPEAPFIAITGTNGKSTTTTLIAHVLKEAGKRVEVGGNLGQAALSLLPVGPDGIYVLELSSYQLDITPTPIADVALLLNITPDHLDRHGDLAGYVAAKERIFARQGPGDVAVIGIDDERERAVLRWLAVAGSGLREDELDALVAAVDVVVLLIDRVPEEADERERREREDWAYEVALLMRNRFMAYEVYDEWFEGLISREQWRKFITNVKGMCMFRDVMFERLATTSALEPVSTSGSARSSTRPTMMSRSRAVRPLGLGPASRPMVLRGTAVTIGASRPPTT